MAVTSDRPLSASFSRHYQDSSFIEYFPDGQLTPLCISAQEEEKDCVSSPRRKLEDVVLCFLKLRVVLFFSSPSNPTKALPPARSFPLPGVLRRDEDLPSWARALPPPPRGQVLYKTQQCCPLLFLTVGGSIYVEASYLSFLRSSPHIKLIDFFPLPS